MDIKDVNNGLLNLLQANRANLQGTAVNTTGFGDLLVGLESEKTQIGRASCRERV